MAFRLWWTMNEMVVTTSIRKYHGLEKASLGLSWCNRVRQFSSSSTKQLIFMMVKLILLDVSHLELKLFVGLCRGMSKFDRLVGKFVRTTVYKFNSPFKEFCANWPNVTLDSSHWDLPSATSQDVFQLCENFQNFLFQ